MRTGLWIKLRQDLIDGLSLKSRLSPISPYGRFKSYIIRGSRFFGDQ